MAFSKMSWTVEEILPEDEDERGNDIPEPKLASPILRALGDAHPLPRLTHVKRIRKTQEPGGAPRMSIVLCPVPEMASELRSKSVIFPDTVAAIIQKYGLTPFLAEVPGRPARSLEESKEDCKVWPVTFHPNREGAGPVKEELTDDDLRSMWRFMQEALKEAKKAADCGQPANGCVIVDPDSQRVVGSGFDRSGRPPGDHAVSPTDPLIKRPHPPAQITPPEADAADTESKPRETLATDTRTTAGETSVVVNETAPQGCLPVETLKQSRGRTEATLPPETPPKSLHLSKMEWTQGNELSDIGSAGSSKKTGTSVSRIDWHPLKHAAIAAIDACAEADHNQFPDFGRQKQSNLGLDKEEGRTSMGGNLGSSLEQRSCGEVVNNGPLIAQGVSTGQLKDSILGEAPYQERGISVGRAAVENDEKRRKMDPGGVNGPGVFITKPYLCTGFDAYLVREPCTMCAMALVHSRVRRVVYGVVNPRTGALGGRLNLQTKKSLNHHYKVFCMNLMIDEVEDSCNKAC